MLGSNPVSITQGNAYTDAGATATDDIDGSVNVTIDASLVNTAVVGSYTVSFSATDAANNTANTTRTVNVVNTPTISGKIAEWKLDENSGLTAQDQSAQSIDLTLNNGTSWATGKSGSALSFNGSSQDASNANGASSVQTASVTVSAWAYPVTTNTSWEWIAAQGDNYGLYLSPNGRRVTFYIRNTTSDWVNAVSVNNSFEFDQWQHFSGSFDAATHTLKVYVNGVEVATNSNAQAIQYDTGDGFTIGSMQGGRYFNGQIDEVQVFDSALSQAQMAQLATP